MESKSKPINKEKVFGVVFKHKIEIRKTFIIAHKTEAEYIPQH